MWWKWEITTQHGVIFESRGVFNHLKYVMRDAMEEALERGITVQEIHFFKEKA